MRNAIQDEIDRKRQEDKLRKIREIKEWRLEHSKVREQLYKSQREAQIAKEKKALEEVQRKAEVEGMKREARRQSNLLKMRAAMSE